MKDIKGVISEVNITGPFKSNKGFKDYYRHTYVINDQKFSRLTGSDKPLQETGTLVQVIFEPTKTEKGIFNQIDNIVEVTEGPGASTQSSLPVSGTPKATIASSVGSGGTTTSILTKEIKIDEVTKNLLIARMNAVTSAVALSNSAQDGSSIEEVLETAEKILAFTTAPLSKK